MAFQDNYYHTSISAHFWRPPTQCRITVSWVWLPPRVEMITPLSNLFQYLSTLIAFLLRLTGIFLNLCPFTLVMSLSVTKNSLALSPLLLLIRNLLKFFLYLFQSALHGFLCDVWKGFRSFLFHCLVGFCVCCLCVYVVVVFIFHVDCSCLRMKLNWGQKINSETALQLFH